MILLKELFDEVWLGRLGGDAVFPLPPAENGLVFAGAKAKADDEKIPGLNVALGFALGLNSLAATLSLDIEDFDEV